MTSDLSVTRVGPVAAPPDPARPQGAGAADPRIAGKAPAEPAGKSLPNPTLRLDPGLAIVVIEFRDESGAVRSTIPTEQQLDAYRTWERGNIGAPPPGRRDTRASGDAEGGTKDTGTTVAKSPAPETPAPETPTPTPPKLSTR